MLSPADWIGIAGVAVGLVGIIAAIYFYKKTIRTKILSVAYTKIVAPLPSVPGVHKTYKGAAAEELSRAFFLLWNTGTAPIEKDDFVSPIEVKDGAVILDIEIFEKDPLVQATVDNTNHTVSVDLLRPNEAMIVRVDAHKDAYQLDLSINMKSTDMTTVLKYDRAFVAIAILAAIFVIAWLVVGIWIDYFALPNDITLTDKIIKVVTLILWTAVVISVAIITGKRVLRFTRNITPDIVWHYLVLRRTVSAAAESSRQLRSQIPELWSK
jgi:hypothetical protein